MSCNKQYTFFFRTSFYLLIIGYCCPWSHTHTHTHTYANTHSVGLFWTRDGLVAEAFTWQHTKFTTDEYQCFRWDSKPQSQETSGFWSTQIQKYKRQKPGVSVARRLYPPTKLQDLITEKTTTWDFTVLKPDITYLLKGAVCLFRLTLDFSTLTLN